jgi:hypothetical protein
MKKFLALVFSVVFAFPLGIADGRHIAFTAQYDGNTEVFLIPSEGGVVGIRGSLPLVDGGILFKPEFSRYDVEGRQWIMEGHGVEPDIVVDNDPAKEFAGVDEQLNKAIEVILEALKTGEKTIPPPPSYPAKN